MRNNNIFKGQLVRNSVFVDWIADESAVGGVITSIEDDLFAFEIADTTFQVANNIDVIDTENKGVAITDEAIFEKIRTSIAVGEDVRIGSGQWTFYSEPDEVRFIISEHSDI